MQHAQQSSERCFCVVSAHNISPRQSPSVFNNRTDTAKAQEALSRWNHHFKSTPDREFELRAKSAIRNTQISYQVHLLIVRQQSMYLMNENVRTATRPINSVRTLTGQAIEKESTDNGSTMVRLLDMYSTLRQHATRTFTIPKFYPQQ